MAEQYNAQDDYNPLGEHVVEIPARDHLVHPAPRRSLATIGVAVFLALAGAGIAVILISDQVWRANNDAAQREELRVGWQMLGVLAADGARSDSDGAAQPSVVHSAPQAVPPSVVVVTVPGQSPPSSVPSGDVAPQAQPNPAVTNAATAPAPVANAAPQPMLNPAVPLAVAPATTLPSGASQALTPAAPALNGTVPASPPTQSLPSGTVPASPPTQSLPSGTVPASPPITFPASQACGLSTCDMGSVCCNPSCGICTTPGAICSLQPCS
jgi:hypothetical protein